SSANAAQTLSQSVLQATSVNRAALTARRNSLLTDPQLLFVGFRPRLIEPAMPFLGHVHDQPEPARLLERPHHQRDGHALARGHFLVEHAGPAFRDRRLAVPDLIGEMVARLSAGPELSRLEPRVADNHAI